METTIQALLAKEGWITHFLTVSESPMTVRDRLGRVIATKTLRQPLRFDRRTATSQIPGPRLGIM